MKKTRKAYEEHLNEIGGITYYDDGAKESIIKKYGSFLRRNDPIAFNVGYQEWVREND